MAPSPLRPALAALLLAVSTALTGCGPNAHERLVQQARGAEKREAWLEAADYYTQACQMNPKDTASCKRATEMRDYSAQLYSFRARKLCEAGDLQGCLRELAPVRNIDSAHKGEVSAVVELAAKLAHKQCLGAPDLKAQVQRMSCLQSVREALWDSSYFQSRYLRVAKELSDTLLVLANNSDANAPGSFVAYADAAACMAPLDSSSAAQLSARRGEFERNTQTAVQLEYGAGGDLRPAQGTCQSAIAQLGRGLVCADRSESLANLSVAVEVYSRDARWQKTHTDESRVARYVSGTRTVNNPEYQRMQLEYELAADRARDAEKEFREAERTCNSTQLPADCSTAETRERAYRDRETEMNNARSRYNSTPATYQEDIISDHIYRVRTHVWTAPFRAALTIAGSPSSEVTSIVHSDVEQEGFAPAGIVNDPYTPPGETYFRDQGLGWLHARLVARMGEEMDKRAAAIEASCKGDKLDCWARAQRLRGDEAYGLRLLEAFAAGGKGGGGLSCAASQTR